MTGSAVARGVLIGGQKSEVKTAVLMEPAVNAQVSTDTRRPEGQHQEKSKGWGVRENWIQMPALPLNKWPWASYLISLSHHLLIYNIKIIKSTSQGMVQKFIKIKHRTHLAQCLASWRYSMNLNPIPGAALRGS